MKLFCLATAIGLGLALSVGAQTTTDEQQQQPQPAQPKGKAKVEQSTGVQENASTGTVKEKGEVKAEASKQGGNVSQSTTVFRHGQQTSERLSLRRTIRERTDTHFSIGTTLGIGGSGRTPSCYSMAATTIWPTTVAGIPLTGLIPAAITRPASSFATEASLNKIGARAAFVEIPRDCFPRGVRIVEREPVV